MAEPSAHVLFVCTANLCRSPLGEVTTAARAAERSLPVTVSSAGIQAVPGAPATPPTVDAARRLGFDLSDHRSAALMLDAVQSADLVLGLERRHVQEVVLLDPAAFAKTYTLKELARRGSEIGPRASTEGIPEWLARVHRGRRPTDLLGVSSEDDVSDPTGSRAVDHRGTAEDIHHLVTEILELLYPGASA